MRRHLTEKVAATVTSQCGAMFLRWPFRVLGHGVAFSEKLEICCRQAGECRKANVPKKVPWMLSGTGERVLQMPF
ncbi:hypothetical protein Tco_1241953 [Tanacetum coccineum]